MIVNNLATNASQSIEVKTIKVYVLLLMMMVVGLCLCVITAPKIIQLGPITFPCCNVFFALLTFPVTDTISEVFGKSYANKAVLLGFFAQFLFVFLLQMALFMPAAHFWSYQDAFVGLFGSSSRIILASMVAFLVSQYWDVYIYAVLKKACAGKWLWLRNNLSTMSSQLINSLLFIGIAFGNHEYLASLIVGSVLFKWLIALVDTPLVYGLVHVCHNYLDRKTIAYTPDM